MSYEENVLWYVMIAMIDVTPYNVIRYRKWKQSGNADGRYEVLEE